MELSKREYVVDIAHSRKKAMQNNLGTLVFDFSERSHSDRHEKSLCHDSYNSWFEWHEMFVKVCHLFGVSRKDARYQKSTTFATSFSFKGTWLYIYIFSTHRSLERLISIFWSTSVTGEMYPLWKYKLLSRPIKVKGLEVGRRIADTNIPSSTLQWAVFEP